MTLENPSKRMLEVEDARMVHTLVVNILSSCPCHAITDET